MVLNKIKSICIIKKKGAIIVMEKAKFLEDLINKARQINVDITEEKANRFYEYNNLLLEWNEKINLTAITDEREIILKHFIDSLTINRYIGNAETVMDIGTGAGFPGIPLKIVNENKSFILVDALNKRINFLEEVKNNLKLNDLDLIHSRSEDLAKDLNYRENMDIVTSRAVANLRVLVEYMLPFVKLNGLCICMKGPNVKDIWNRWGMPRWPHTRPWPAITAAVWRGRRWGLTPRLSSRTLPPSRPTAGASIMCRTPTPLATLPPCTRPCRRAGPALPTG